jgi:hypothetical protein
MLTRHWAGHPRKCIVNSCMAFRKLRGVLGCFQSIFKSYPCTLVGVKAALTFTRPTLLVPRLRKNRLYFRSHYEFIASTRKILPLPFPLRNNIAVLSRAAVCFVTSRLHILEDSDHPNVHRLVIRQFCI